MSLFVDLATTAMWLRYMNALLDAPLTTTFAAQFPALYSNSACKYCFSRSRSCFLPLLQFAPGQTIDHEAAKFLCYDPLREGDHCHHYSGGSPMRRKYLE